MESPKRYIGYDKDGKQVTIAYGVDANKDIDPSIVKAKINNLDKVMTEEICKIQKALLDITKDASQAIIVNTTSKSGEIEDLVLNLEQYKKVPNQVFEQVYTESVNKHDSMQSDYNQQAENRVRNTSNVDKVVQG